MPEYLSPGVYLEEIPSGLKAIEGVSTSTAAFVGRARRGTVPGYIWPGSSTPDLPFTPTGGFVLTPDPSPVLVTSFSDFQRQFGTPLPIPPADAPSDSDFGYLGWAVRAFFDNKGKRLYIARIVDPNDATSTATPSTTQAAQGVVYRLARSTQINDGTSTKPIFFTSTRGIKTNDTITFFRHKDGTNALATPSTPAVAVGTGAVSPFALKDGDQLNVTTNTPSVLVVSAKIVAKPATAQTSAAATFNLADGATLQLRVGPATAPVQTIVFSSTDPVAPITPDAATLAQVEAVLKHFVTGVQVSQVAGAVVIVSNVQGTAARLEIIGGTAAGPLGLSIGPVAPPAGGTVPDAAQVTIPQLAALLSSANFNVADDGSRHLQFTTSAVGGTVSITLDDPAAGGDLLKRLGFGAGTTLTVNGTTGVTPSLAVASYDLPSNSLILTSALPAKLDVNDVFAVITAPTPAIGPMFFARTPGDWSAGLSIAINNADRAPTQVTGPVAAGLLNTHVPVQSVTGLYVGAIVEIDHNGTTRSIHQVTDINFSTRVITIDPTLPAPALTVVVNPTTDKPAWVRTLEIDIVVTDNTGVTPAETYRGLSWNQSPVADLRRHYAWTINANSSLVWVQPPGVGLPPLPGSEGITLDSQPTTTDGFPMKFDTLGVQTFTDLDDTWVGLDGGPGARSGIQSLNDLTDARIIAAPGKSSQTIQVELIAQCENLRYRFAVLDGERHPAGGSITSILTHRNLYDTSFAAYYQPWVTVTIDGQTRQLPPSGYLAGIYARVDNARAVWKAPANESVLNVTGLSTKFTTGEQDLLNPRGVNLIRQFDIGGILVWGARTLSSDPDVKYINVRRTLIFIEASLDQGTQWVVFEPNSPDTWARVRDSVGAFLLTQWRTGALFGLTPDEAYFVRCDETTMTADDIDNGRLIVQIGVAIVRPAEFVILQIQQITNFGANP
jgi:phage tail sheath protein FI